MKKILVPTDFSQLADQALETATFIARKTGAEVELIHVIEAPYSKDFSPIGEVKPHDALDDVFVLKSIELARKKFASIIDDIRFVGARINPKIKTGNVYKHLSDIIANNNIDLIVMGTEGATGFLKGIFNKTNTEEVVMKANCMVLSVKQNLAGEFKLKNVIYATDFKDDSPEFISILKKLQEIFDFTLHVTFINSIVEGKEEEEKIQKRIDSFIKKYELKDYQTHIREDLTEYVGLNELAKDVNADVIALVTHQRRGFWHWLGGLSEDLVNYSEKPVLTFPAN